MRVLAFRFPVERVEGHDVQETLPRVAALIDVSVSCFLAVPFRARILYPCQPVQSEVQTKLSVTLRSIAG